jgi:DNA-binding CsgD family transcriptional regulator
MANEVSSLFVPYFVRSVARAGVDPAPHLRGLAIEHVRPMPGRRVDWNELATFLNRVGETLTLEQQERLGDAFPTENALMVATARVVMPPKLFYRAIASMGEMSFRHMRCSGEAIDERHVRTSMSIDRHHTGCLPFFRGSVGEFRTISDLWGIGPSVVEAEVTPWGGTYFVTLPEAARGIAWPHVAQRVAREFVKAAEHLFASGDSKPPTDVLALQRTHGLTRAEARVVSRLAVGLDLPTIAAELGVGVETVRSHLKRAYAKTGTSRQAELVRLVLVDSVPE